MTSSFPLWKCGVNAASSFIFIMTIWYVANLCQGFCVSPEIPELHMSTGRLSSSLKQGDMTAFYLHHVLLTVIFLPGLYRSICFAWSRFAGTGWTFFHLAVFFQKAAFSDIPLWAGKTSDPEKDCIIYIIFKSDNLKIKPLVIRLLCILVLPTWMKRLHCWAEDQQHLNQRLETFHLFYLLWGCMSRGWLF